MDQSDNVSDEGVKGKRRGSTTSEEQLEKIVPSTALATLASISAAVASCETSKKKPATLTFLSGGRSLPSAPTSSVNEKTPQVEQAKAEEAVLQVSLFQEEVENETASVSPGQTNTAVPTSMAGAYSAGGGAAVRTEPVQYSTFNRPDASAPCPIGLSGQTLIALCVLRV